MTRLLIPYTLATAGIGWLLSYITATISSVFNTDVVIALNIFFTFAMRYSALCLAGAAVFAGCVSVSDKSAAAEKKVSAENRLGRSSLLSSNSANGMTPTRRWLTTMPGLLDAAIEFMERKCCMAGKFAE